jgi:uncharacterized protein
MSLEVVTPAAPALSAELFLLPLEDSRYVVYAPLRRAAFIANSAVVRFLGRLQAGHYDAAADPDGSLLKLLRGLEMVDAPPETTPLSRQVGVPQPVSVTLLLTTRCSLRCTYCYASAGESPVRSMRLETARRGIDYVSSNAASRCVPWFEVSYHGGGEPTLNWSVLTKSFEYARQTAAERDLTLRSSVATNAMLNDRQIGWITANLTGANISFDGLPSVQDSQRPTASGRASSPRVIRTLRRFDEAGFNYGIRLTVLAAHVASLADSIEFITSNFKPNAIQIEPVYQLGRWQDGPSGETEEFIAAFREAQRRASSHGRTIQFSAARLGALTNHYCSVSQDLFCLTPDGNVTACYEAFSEASAWAKVFFYGRPEKDRRGYVFDESVVQRLRAQAVENRSHCQGCFAKWHCGGDCTYKALELKGDVEFAGAGRCQITRELTKDQILERIAASGGLFWHELPGMHGGG